MDGAVHTHPEAPTFDPFGTRLGFPSGIEHTTQKKSKQQALDSEAGPLLHSGCQSPCGSVDHTHEALGCLHYAFTFNYNTISLICMGPASSP